MCYKDSCGNVIHSGDAVWVSNKSIEEAIKNQTTKAFYNHETYGYRCEGTIWSFIIKVPEQIQYECDRCCNTIYDSCGNEIKSGDILYVSNESIAEAIQTGIKTSQIFIRKDKDLYFCTIYGYEFNWKFVVKVPSQNQNKCQCRCRCCTYPC